MSHSPPRASQTGLYRLAAFVPAGPPSCRLGRFSHQFVRRHGLPRCLPFSFALASLAMACACVYRGPREVPLYSCGPSRLEAVSIRMIPLMRASSLIFLSAPKNRIQFNFQIFQNYTLSPAIFGLSVSRAAIPLNIPKGIPSCRKMVPAAPLFFCFCMFVAFCVMCSLYDELIILHTEEVFGEGGL